MQSNDKRKLKEESKYMFKVKGKYNTAKVFASSADDETIKQLEHLCDQEWVVGSNIAIMPDNHAGKGCTIGTTMTIKDKVCPNLVGVDIGCGMLTVQLPKELNQISLQKLDNFIDSSIPSGFEINEERVYNPLYEGLHLEKLRCYDSIKHKEHIERAVGSLGGGNHFIEVDEDDEKNRYLVIHTGSRNLGKQVAEYYQKLADEDCNNQNDTRKKELNALIMKLKNEGRQNEIQSAIKSFNMNYQSITKIDKDLCYLEGHHLDDYLHDMFICQHFAQVNRKYIALKILEHLFEERYGTSEGAVWLEIDGDCGYEDKVIDVRMNVFETVHNYINPRDEILRKGAISARIDEKVLIPINMRDGAIIGVGKGNPEYNYSGPHGAGRIMSRTNAKRLIDLEDFKNTMQGIYSTSVGITTLDESPMAYKSLDEILNHVKDTIDVLKIIKPIYNYKAH